MLLRPFQAEDTDAVVDLWIRAELTVPWNDPRADIATYVASGQGLFFVVSDGRDSLVASAMAGFDGHRGWLYYLAVDEAHRRNGVGRRLVRRCERELAARGCPKLNLMVREGNAAAHGFYAALGYEPSAVETLGRRLDTT